MTVAPVGTYAVLSDVAVARRRALIVIRTLCLVIVSIAAIYKAQAAAEWIASFKFGDALFGQFLIPLLAGVVLACAGLTFAGFFVTEAFRHLHSLAPLDTEGLRDLSKCLALSPSDETFAEEIKRAVANNETLREREIENARMRKALISEAAERQEALDRMTKALASAPQED
jgi:hypothetical protein